MHMHLRMHVMHIHAKHHHQAKIYTRRSRSRGVYKPLLDKMTYTYIDIYIYRYLRKYNINRIYTDDPKKQFSIIGIIYFLKITSKRI